MKASAIVIFSLLTHPLFAESKLHKVLVAVQGIACAASAFDGATTAAAIGIGAHETNPFLAGSGPGNLSYPKLITYKAIGCGVPFAMDYVVHRIHGESKASDLISIGESGALAGVFTWAGIHNMSVINQIHRQGGE